MVDLADEQNDNAPSNGGDGGADTQANQPVVPPATPSSSSSAARQAQLAQLKELQSKLDEQRRQTQELRAALEQQHTARGTHAQAAGRVARERILVDNNVDKSPELKTAGEKLVAAAYLLQAMPEPSTPSGRNLRREAQDSSSKLPCSRPRVLCLACARRSRSSVMGLRTRTVRFLCTHPQRRRARQP